MPKLQNEDFKTEAEITGATNPGTASQLLNDTKIWVTGNAINKTLDDAIVDGDIGGGGGGSTVTKSQEIRHSAAGSTMLDRDNEARFTLGNLADVGSDLISIDDDAGNTRTKFTAIEDCIVTVSFTAVKTSSASSRAAAIWKNGVAHQYGDAEASSSSNFRHVTSTLRLLATDYITVGIINDTIVSDGNPVQLSLTALAGVGVLFTEPIRYTETNSQSIPENVVTIINFNNSHFDADSLVTTGATWKYTAPSDGKYNVDAFAIFVTSAAWSANESGNLYIYVDGVQRSTLDLKHIGVNVTSAISMSVQGSDTIDLLAGEEVDIRVLHNIGGGVPLALSGGIHGSRVNINKVQSGGASQNELATHYLTADLVANDGDIADFRFINLVVDNWYTLQGQVVILYSSGSGSNCGISAVHNGGGILRLSKTGATDSNQDTKCGSITFKATATSITFTTSGGNFSGTKSVLGDGTHLESWFTLEERPEIVETTKWD